MSTFTKLTANCAVMALFAVVGFSQVVTIINGIVLGKDGKPATGADVKIIRTDVAANYAVKTNKDGKYTYPTLPIGLYDVVVGIGGVDQYKISGVKTDPSKAMEVDIDLSKVEAQQAAAAAAAGANNDKEKAAQSEKDKAAKAKYDEEKKKYDEEQAKDASLQAAFTTGMEAAKSKNWNVAIDNLQKAGTLDPKQDAVWAQLGEAYNQRALTVKGPDRTADFSHAAEAFTKAAELKPADPEYHNSLAIAAARSSKLDVAQAEVAKAVQLDPTKTGMYYRNLGRVYFDSNQPEQAEGAYKKAIAADPNDADVQFQLGLAMIQRATVNGDKMVAPPGTAEAFQQYLALAPNGVNADEAKGMLSALGAPVATGFKGATPPPAAKGKGKAK